ncbi:MAG: NADH-quinone oxidoreductase subunit C [Planctomycetota bacterium]
MPPKKSKLSPEQLFAVVKESYADLVASENAGSPGPTAMEAHIELSDAAWSQGSDARFQEFMTFCRDDSRLYLDLLSCVSAVDYPDRDVIEVVYFLDSTVHNHWLVVKAPLPRSAPSIATVEKIWRTADWHEREAFDLLGVEFRGHHNLVRILCAEDWVGHPLRKDYVAPDEVHGMKNVVY